MPAYLPKGSLWYFAYSQVPRRMGQILNRFFPNIEKPVIRPISASVKPLKESLDSLTIKMETMVTRPEFTSAAPTPAI